MDSVTGACGTCRAEIYAGDRFCTACGAPVAAAETTPASPQPAAVPKSSADARPSAQVVQMFHARRPPAPPPRKTSGLDDDLQTMLSDAERAGEYGDGARARALLDQAVARFPGEYLPRAERGLWHFENQDWHEAVRDLQAATDLEEEVEVHIWVYLGQGLVELGEIARAMECFDQAIGAVDGYSAAYYYRGLCRLSLSLEEEGLEDLEAAIQLDPADKDPLIARARYALETSDFEAARDDLLQAYALEPEDPDISFHLGRAQAGMEQPGLAARCFARVIELDREYPDVWREQGVALTQLEQYEEALEAFNLALEADPSDALALVARGRLHTECEDLSKAELDLRHALRLMPDLGPAHLLLGHVQRLTGKMTDAAAAFDRAAALGEDEHAILFGRAWIWLDRDDVASAVEAFRELIDADPDDVDHRVGLGYALSRSNEGLAVWCEARDVFTGVLEEDPELAPVYAARAICQFLLMEPALAIADSDEALSRDAETASLDAVRAACYLALGEHNKARQAIARAWSGLSGDDDDDLAAALVARARLRLAEGQPDAAQEDIARALELDQQDDMAHFVQGQVRGSRGDTLGAIESYTAALEIDPRYPQFLAARGQALKNHGMSALALDDFRNAFKLLSEFDVAGHLRDEVELEIKAIEAAL